MAGTSERTAYSFELPRDLIAQRPAPRRDESRLLALARASEGLEHRLFRDLPRLLGPDDLLVLNDTRVFPARVEVRRASGGLVRGLLLDPPENPSLRMMLQGSGRLAAGERLRVGAAGELVLARSLGAGIWEVDASDPAVRAELAAAGRAPLPPYIRRARGSDPRDAEDRERYQTVYARSVGAVAAPTAGLHFSPEVLGEIRARGTRVATVTLHVGPGTFLPVRVLDLAEHRMLAERYEIPRETAEAAAAARARGGRVVAVGTTVVRALEAASRAGTLRAGAGETDIFIRPPFEFHAVDALLTNFHLPESTLLMLVAAFAGRERVLAAYGEAVRLRYRFFSYGDAMFIS
ncbi:MAG: tRNA preQ1(34) S-adenosylmethionine ribosyltransferase-isomerase QueA [Planctomycetes bacterium]|nr:tRNA preQ1(34) S-adenosylmethionine ribosyltransferase-isomerase QueA [Planctomycetota bacterium]